MVACAVGLVFSAAVFSGSLLLASSFRHFARNLTVERVRQDLQTSLDDETVSTVAAKRFLETLPSGGGDFKAVDHEHMREHIRALGAPDYLPKPISALPYVSDAPEHCDGQDGLASPVNALEGRANEFVREIRIASAACALLFGLACWLGRRAALTADAPALATKIAAYGAVLIGAAFAGSWFLLDTASQAHVAPAIVVATSVVLALVSDALYNEFRATRTALDLIQWWP
jgi:hypothetical protein